MKIKCYNLKNAEKINRAIFGSMGHGGKLYGGVGESYTEEQLLAAYDRLGGLITKNGRKVKNGCFYDVNASKKGNIVPIEKPKIILVLSDLEGNLIEVSDGKELTPELKAAENKKKAAENKKKATENKNEATENKNEATENKNEATEKNK